MPILDIIILIVFAVAAFFGYRKGFIGQVGAIAAIVVATIACRVLVGPVTEAVFHVDDPSQSAWTRYSSSAVSAAVIYLLAYYGVILIAKVLKTVTHTLMLGPLDSIAGAAVSVVKWFMVLSVLANLYLALSPDGKVLATSRLAGGRPVTLIVKLAPAVLGMLNPDTPAEPASPNPTDNGQE